MNEPMLSGAIVPRSEGGCHTAYDFDRTLLKAYDNNHDRSSGHFVRLYNEAIESWISNLIIIDGRPITVVKASPMRAFSSYRHLLKNRMTGDDLPADMDDIERFPLPFANYTRGVPKVNKTLQQQAWPIRNIGFLDDTNKRRTAWTRYPKALVIPYTIDLWCKYESHMDYIMQAAMEQFVPVAYWQVQSPFTEETYTMPIKLIGDIVDNSELEHDSVEDRLLRLTMNIEVEAWMFYDIKQAPTFQIETDMYVMLKSGEDEENNDGGLDLFTKSTKMTDLAPLTLEEIEESTSQSVPDTQN